MDTKLTLKLDKYVIDGAKNMLHLKKEVFPV
jgi:hypothetical protein